MPTTPAILFLVFNRPAHTRAVLARIRGVRPARLYIHADGPRADRPGEAERVAAVRHELEAGIDWPCAVHRLFRAENRGLRAGVREAITWFFEQEEYGIVLEDDCLPDPSFFPFCAELLERYRDDERVMHIGGSNLAEAWTRQRPESYVFTRFSFVWGWASWRRAWQRFSPDLDGLEAFAQSPAFEQFLPSAQARRYMLDKFRQTSRGENNSWAYAWFYTILNNNGLCIVPAINLVQNTGVGESDATHTRGRNVLARRQAKAVAFPLWHPESRRPDPALEPRFFYTSQKRRFRLWIWTVLRFFTA